MVLHYPFGTHIFYYYNNIFNEKNNNIFLWGKIIVNNLSKTATEIVFGKRALHVQNYFQSILHFIPKKKILIKRI